MARRARRGLADWSDSDEDECTKTDPKKLKSHVVEEETVSLFDTKVYSAHVLNTIRDEEDKVLGVKGPSKLSNLSVISCDDEPPALIGDSPTVSLNKRKSSLSFKSAKRSKLVDLISDDDDEDDEDDELTELIKSTSKRNASIHTAELSEKAVTIDSNDRNNKSLVGDDDDYDEESFLSDNAEDLLAEDKNVYRVLVKHLGVDNSIWVHLNEKDTMSKVFVETTKVVGEACVTLMIDVDGEREEVSPTQTAVDLKMSLDRCAVVYSYPATVPDTSTAQEPCFKLKIVTTNRRAKKEIVCRPDESFAEIFRRYCDESNLKREDVVFKFDGDVLSDAQTPRELDMESEEQIEAHGLEAGHGTSAEQKAVRHAETNLFRASFEQIAAHVTEAIEATVSAPFAERSLEATTAPAQCAESSPAATTRPARRTSARLRNR